MDIYFCDSCAARVSDADLKRGQGIRKADVTICGSCVEDGRGGDLLEAAAAASMSDSSQAEAEQAVPRQMPDTDALVRAGQELFAREAAQAAQAGGDSEDDWPEQEEAVGFDEDDMPESDADPQYGNMAEAANSFSALGAGGEGAGDEDDSGFTEPESDAEADAKADAPSAVGLDEDAADSEAEPPVQPDEAHAGEAEVDVSIDPEPDALGAQEPEPVGLFPEDDGDLPPQGNVDTVEIPVEEQPAATGESGSSSSRRARSSRRGSRGATTGRSGRQEEPRSRTGRSATRSASKSDRGRGAAGAAAANGKSARGGSNRTNRSSSGRQSSQQRGSSTRTGTRGGGGKGKAKFDSTSMVLLGLTGVALLVFVIVLVVWMNKGDPPVDNRPADVTDRLQLEVSRIKKEVVQALRGNDIAELEHAHSLVKGDSLERAYQEVEKAAKAKGYTDENVHNYSAMKDYFYLKSMERTLRDRIAQLKAQR